LSSRMIDKPASDSPSSRGGATLCHPVAVHKRAIPGRSAGWHRGDHVRVGPVLALSFEAIVAARLTQASFTIRRRSVPVGLHFFFDLPEDRGFPVSACNIRVLDVLQSTLQTIPAPADPLSAPVPPPGLRPAAASRCREMALPGPSRTPGATGAATFGSLPAARHLCYRYPLFQPTTAAV